ncbi:MAG: hypothetical protein PHI27_06390 [Eubacteriales bacterium]|nr:hypothetical protein [Eubacteriales bacterium]MDD3881863.1 hypothetical protein [Eubacteriales bacterium]MDD4512892.1 hypothetical protein [Eubacteriales bacterium]
MKTMYCAYYPRNFSNEYTVIRVETPAELERLNRWYDNLRSDPANRSLCRVSVADLRSMKASEKHARKFDQAFSGYCDPWEPVSVSEFLREYECC